MKTKINKKGFSLVELLVVITIIAILSVVAYTAVGGQTTKARNSKRQQDLTTIQNALEIYFIQNDKYPPATASQHIDDTKLTKKYISKIPADPKKDGGGNPIKYKYATGANDKTYQLAATLEDEETGNLTAYVVGNGKDLLKKGKPSGSCTVTDGNGSCFPYEFK